MFRNENFLHYFQKNKLLYININCFKKRDVKVMIYYLCKDLNALEVMLLLKAILQNKVILQDKIIS